MTEDTGYVYTLSDPRTEEPKYVGATATPKERYYSHLSDPHNDKLATWIEELAEHDEQPGMNLVQIDDLENLAAAERRVLDRIAAEHDVFNDDMQPSYSGRGDERELTEQVIVRCNSQLLDRADALADKMSTTRSGVVRQLVEDEYEQLTSDA